MNAQADSALALAAGPGPSAAVDPAWRLALPMVVYALLIGGIGFRTADFTYRIIPQFGFYLATALYMGLFAWWLGRYKIWWVAAIMVAFPIVIFAVFEIGFRVSLPKSFLYSSGLLPF